MRFNFSFYFFFLYKDMFNLSIYHLESGVLHQNSKFCCVKFLNMFHDENMTQSIWRTKIILYNLEPITFFSNLTVPGRLKILSFNWYVLTGGFGSYLFAMSERIAKQSTDTLDFKKLSLGWIIGFLFIASFLGLFSVVPLRKVSRIFVHVQWIYTFHWWGKKKRKEKKLWK